MESTAGEFRRVCVVTTPDEAATRALAARLGRRARVLAPAGAFLALHGDLGAGKTVFVQGLAAGLAITEDAPVVSPTFTIARSYEVEDSPLELHHVDAYRLTGVEDLETIGFEEMCGVGRVTCVEWASRVEGALPEDRVDLWIEMLPMDEPYVRGEAPRAPRRLRFVARGAASARWLESLDDARLGSS